jgi:hypothetical protein
MNVLLSVIKGVLAFAAFLLVDTRHNDFADTVNTLHVRWDVVQYDLLAEPRFIVTTAIRATDEFDLCSHLTLRLVIN